MSFAAPLVAGQGALLFEQGVPPESIRQHIVGTAGSLNDPDDVVDDGHGVIDVEQSVLAPYRSVRGRAPPPALALATRPGPVCPPTVPPGPGCSRRNCRPPQATRFGSVGLAGGDDHPWRLAWQRRLTFDRELWYSGAAWDRLASRRSVRIGSGRCKRGVSIVGLGMQRGRLWAGRQGGAFRSAVKAARLAPQGSGTGGFLFCGQGRGFHLPRCVGKGHNPADCATTTDKRRHT